MDPMREISSNQVAFCWKQFPDRLERSDCSFPGFNQSTLNCSDHGPYVPLRCIGEAPTLCLLRSSEAAVSTVLYPLYLEETSSSTFRVGIEINDSLNGLGVFFPNPCYPYLKNVATAGVVSTYIGDNCLVHIPQKYTRTQRMYSLQEVASGRPFGTENGEVKMARSIFFGGSEMRGMCR